MFLQEPNLVILMPSVLSLQEEKEMAHLYERRRFPYPGDQEAVEEFIASGGTLGTTIGPKGFIDSGKVNFQKQLQSKKFDQEARKLWFFLHEERGHSSAPREKV